MPGSPGHSIRNIPNAGRSSRSVAATPSSAGMQSVRSDEFTRKISSPPGRRIRAASGSQRSGSAHRQAPYSEIARSKAASRHGTSSASAWSSGNSRPCWRWSRRAVESWVIDASMPTTRAPRRASQADTYAVPHPSSTTSLSARSVGRTPSCDSGTLQTPQAGSSRAQDRSPPATCSLALHVPAGAVAAHVLARLTVARHGEHLTTGSASELSRPRHTEVGVALGLEPGIRVGHQIGARAAEHDLEVRGLEAHVLEAVNDARRCGDTVPAPEHRLLAAPGPVLEEDLHLAVEDEEHLLDLVGVGRVTLTRRHEHDAQGELLGGNRSRVALAGGAGADVPVLGAPVALDAGIGERVPVGQAVHEAGHAGAQELIEHRHVR